LSYFIYFLQLSPAKGNTYQYWSGSGSQTKQADRQRSSQLGSLTLVDQLFATLMRLRLGLLVQDIADRFNISSATVSKYFTTWVSLLHLELKILNPFPSRSAIDRTMPDIFKPKYESVRVILDCTEIYVQRSSSILNQALTFSNYKHHNTLKFLIGITPSGVISFVSEAWGGRASDSHITINSGLLDLLDENDTVMADKGFLIEDALRKKVQTGHSSFSWSNSTVHHRPSVWHTGNSKTTYTCRAFYWQSEDIPYIRWSVASDIGTPCYTDFSSMLFAD